MRIESGKTQDQTVTDAGRGAVPEQADRADIETRYAPRERVRFVTATSLFDGHDAAINVIRRVLQDGGAEVIHLGHNRAVREDALREVAKQVRRNRSAFRDRPGRYAGIRHQRGPLSRLGRDRTLPA